MKIKYTIQNPDGRTITATGEFESVNAMKNEIITPGSILVSYQIGNRDIDLGEFMAKKPNDVDLATFSEQMAVMLNANAGSVGSLREVGGGMEKESFRKIVKSIEQKVSEGASISEAMREHPKVFSKMYIALIEAGESSNELPRQLAGLGESLRKDAELRAKLKSAMVYPGITLGLALIMTYVMLTKLVPQFAGFLTSAGGKLPALTLGIMAVSNFLQKSGGFLALGLVGLWILFTRYRKTNEGEKKIDQILLKIPIVGKLVRDVTVSRLARSIAILVENGVKLPEIMRILPGIANNRIFSDALEEISRGIQRGEGVAENMRNRPEVFPRMMASMMQIGENSGSIDETMRSTADHYEREANRQAENLSKAVEPMMMIIVGVLVGTIVIGMFLPMVSLIQQLQN